MNTPPDPTEPQPWHEARHQLERAKERLEDAARETADSVLDRLGVPSADEITARAEDVADELKRHVPLPDPAEVLDPWGMRHRLRRGGEWVADQLEPVGSRLPELRRRSEPALETEDRTAPRPEHDDGWGVVEWVSFLLALEWLSERELSLEFDVDRALWSFDQTSDGVFEVWSETVFTPAASQAARLGDPTMHGDPVAPGAGSSSVLIGGKPALRACDSHLCTKATPVPHVSTAFVSTYGGVFVDGFPALRVGDYVDEGPNGLNPIVAGCPTVSIGPVAPPVECRAPSGEASERRPDRFPFRWRKGEVGRFKGKVILGVDLGGPFVRIDGTVTAARLWAEETSVVDLPLGDVDGDGKVEALRVTTTGKSERILGVSDVELEVHPLTRRVDRAKATPKAPQPKPPELTTQRKIVELS